jgi:hypothetical protein
MTATGTPIPMPIFAPADIPFGPRIGVGGLVPIDVGVVAEIDDCVVVVELKEAVRVAEENASRSELCHHTGIPSPYINKLLTIVVYGVLGSVETQLLTPFMIGLMYSSVEVVDEKADWHR